MSTTDPQGLPMHAARPAGPGRGQKSLARQLVEQALQEAPGPLTAPGIASRTGLNTPEVGRLLAKMLYLGTAHRPAGVGGGYLLGPPPAEPEPTEAAARRPAPAPTVHAASASGLYDGRELAPFAGRPGAMDAFSLPSRVGARRIERRAPMPIGSQPPERAAW